MRRNEDYLDLLIQGKYSGLQVIYLNLAFSQPTHHIGLMRELLILIQA